jgi:hypothetical protein
MHKYDKVLTTAKPRVIANYETLFLPFGVLLWSAFAASTALEIVFLVFVHWLWRKKNWASREVEPLSLLFQGPTCIVCCA